jgi:hypothetical protein
MGKTIWKFKLEVTDSQQIEMPVGAKILTVQTQDGWPCIWALVDPLAKKELRHIQTIGTGHTIENGEGLNDKYLGTYQVIRDWGVLVFHVFEEKG